MKRVSQRRQRNLEIGKLDAANRCKQCRLPMPKSIEARWGTEKQFCSQACYEDAWEAAELMDEIRKTLIKADGASAKGRG